MVRDIEYGYLRHFAHEFAHILEIEISWLDAGWDNPDTWLYSDFQAKLEKAHQQANASGVYKDLWHPNIVRSSRHEYFAEGVEVWYYGIGEGREFASYGAFAEADPLLYELLDKWFAKAAFRRVDDPDTQVFYNWD